MNDKHFPPRVSRPHLSPEELSVFSKKSTLRPAFVVVSVLLGIVLCFTIAILVPNIPVLLFVFVIIAGLQHHLFIIQHEAIHYLLFTNKKWNEFVGRLSGYFIFFTMSYRHLHLKHHQQLGYSDDPDAHNYIYYPCNWRYFFIDALKNITGIAAATQFFRQTTSSSQRKLWKVDREMLGVLLVQGILFGVLWWLGVWYYYFLLWVVPLVTLAKTLGHFRNVVEHVQLRDVGDSELSRYRTILSNPLELFFFAPLNFNYHAEHHFYVGIPYYHLPAVQRILSQQEAYQKVVEVERGYLFFLFQRVAGINGGR